MTKEQFVIQYCLHNPAVGTDRTVEPGRTLNNAEQLAEHLVTIGYLTQE